MEYAIAVFDIGMTNKRLAVYDENLNQLEAVYRTFQPIERGGIPCHDLEGIEKWFIEELRKVAQKYPIVALSVSTHGATFVGVDKKGNPILPCVLYTHEPGPSFHTEFYKRFGNPIELQKSTGTPPFGALINLAKGIWFAQQQFPEDWSQVRYVLNYPQYWGFRFTGQLGAEGTYTGCHTYLWDWERQDWSSVARALGLLPLLPSRLQNSWDTLGTLNPEIARITGLSPEVLVTMGIHDSNAALLPHFAKKGKTGFVLNSTGTWCVIMNPMDAYGFNPEDLGKVVFFNQSAFRSPVKTAIFLGGFEFEQWSTLLMRLYGRSDIPPFDPPRYRRLLSERSVFVLPELTPGSGQYPQSRARLVVNGHSYEYEELVKMRGVPGAVAIQEREKQSSTKENFNASGRGPLAELPYEDAIAALRIGLVMQSLTALERVVLRSSQPIFVEGGFRKDQSYNRLLSAALPGNPLFLTDIAEASAFGAAMIAKMAYTGKELSDLSEDFVVEYREVPKESYEGIGDYRKAWEQWIRG
ncbi:MAG: FGGY family carbohydrate kinase [Breznakiellaceae bacterium]